MAVKLEDGTFENWTRHAILLRYAGDDTVIEPEDDAPIVLKTERTCVSKHIDRVRFLAPESMPEPRENVWLIVAAPVKLACPWRNDLVTPHDMVRDKNDRVIFCRKFAL